MTERGSKYAVITVETETARIVKVVDENGNPARPAKPQEVKKIYQGENGFKYISTILYAHSSPGCVYVNWGGDLVVICQTW